MGAERLNILQFSLEIVSSVRRLLLIHYDSCTFFAELIRLAWGMVLSYVVDFCQLLTLQAAVESNIVIL